MPHLCFFNKYNSKQMARYKNLTDSKKTLRNAINIAAINTLFIIKKQKLNLHIFSLFLFMLITVCSSCSQKHVDKEIKADLSTKAKNELNFAAVNYTVKDGIVTLTGKCSSEKSKHEVEETVKGINIIKGIDNKIVIAPVVINSDFPLKQAADSVLKGYPTVEANVSDDTITLDGKAKKQEVAKILPALNKLHPGKIDNKVTVQ